MKIALKLACLAASLSLPASALAQRASTQVDVGPGHALAEGSADGHWKQVQTESRSGPLGGIGRALAIGAGPNGLSISHSIGLNGLGNGVGHNFNLSIGPQGAHVSRGGVTASGGPARVIAGGSTGFPSYGPPVGGSTVTGFGRQVSAESHSRTRPSVHRAVHPSVRAVAHPGFHHRMPPMPPMPRPFPRHRFPF